MTDQPPLSRITDALAPCVLCGIEQPIGVMTMNDDEQWECDDAFACGYRAGTAAEAVPSGRLDLTAATMTPEQAAEFERLFKVHMKHPQRLEVLPRPEPIDAQVRAYLDQHPEQLRTFLRKEARIGAPWLKEFLKREQRAADGENIRRFGRPL